MVGRGKLEWFEDQLPAPPPGWVTVEVIACGVCHTDLSYLHDGVPTAAKGSLVLGHEIVGRVAGTDRVVVVPAVSPCGECAACKRGRRTACPKAQMPGNHHDGGFATHLNVPARWLCDVPAAARGADVWRYAAVADALTTPYQAVRRARLAAGEVAVVVGAGGVGGFLVEIAVALGATAIVVDVRPEPLARARARGALLAEEVGGREPKAVKQALAKALADAGKEAEGWRIFECSGTPPGQTLAFGLLTRGASLSVVGYTAEPVPLRLSNLMALDAEAYGNWGCDPTLYPEALAMAAEGKIDLAGALQPFPLADAPSVLEAVHHRQLARRAVLVTP